MEETLRDRGDLEFDRIVPIPMHRKKRRKRGYNQAELLAKALAKRLALQCDVELLAKIVERESQSTLKRAARAANVRGTFRAAPAVEGKSILVVDDICTTGETLRAAAAELVGSGAKRVCAIAVAKAA
jgi:ComF family protein